MLVAPMLEKRGECPIEMILQGEKAVKEAKGLASEQGEEPGKKAGSRNGGWKNTKLGRKLSKAFTKRGGE